MSFETTSYPDTIIQIGNRKVNPICTLKNPRNGERFHVAVENGEFSLYRGTHNNYSLTNKIPNEVWEAIKQLDSPDSYKEEIDYEKAHQISETTKSDRDLNEQARVTAEDDANYMQFLAKLKAETGGIHSPMSPEARANLGNTKEAPEEWVSNEAMRHKDSMIETSQDPDRLREFKGAGKSIKIERNK